ncbi:UDP:flavonoid glycosyltransferase YjiC (YdhE family) [Amycolatopsis echigonensis]|uniref:UDP:flavonoid glycosyltransferase YjiC (YdhE family) n=1 Tax=Amycolatopsis echigonensis TaxID=2576905 RepID=A0A2N3WHX3_9PSEU|nr:nucleotide disphospho-sugar-binding domain-containing protein [Amycolatopsis niigatensis]PKV93465.1 UDP:flavonoid glycosyltransferase YjiC (YdhE family) [Amycolatopsis niigatensis]
MQLMFSSGAGYSHLAPMLPLAQAARVAGDEVAFVTGPEALRYVENTGLRAVSVGQPSDPAAAASRWQRAREEMAGMTADERLSHLVAEYLVGLGAASRLDDMVDFVREWQPDLVISNLAERAAVMAACLAGVPYAMHAIGPPKSAATMERAWEVANGLVRQRGLDELPPRDAVPYLDFWPDGLSPADVVWEYPTRWPLQPAGVVPTPGPRPAVLDGLPYDRTVYVTLGTTHNARPGVLEGMVAALRDEPVNVVATIGQDGDVDRFGEQPDHMRIEQFVPQTRLLPAVDAVVCHGGSATVLGALAHGVPVVVLPLATDHFEVAAQIQAAEAGIAVGSGDGILDAVRTVLADRAYRDSTEACAARIAEQPAPSVVVDRLHDLVVSIR